ncbi:3860_t:CDS:2 [Dentiscutata erythropus]|uniref:3860_t:CDS:1 n=1 Tax=Dentiscutata erythropus TaxID=1348616 RepID=A0A9N9F5V4_9GLOM|nr:3860_t:CDS:2 [Dentiscutata erythropus]
MANNSFPEDGEGDPIGWIGLLRLRKMNEFGRELIWSEQIVIRTSESYEQSEQNE